MGKRSRKHKAAVIAGTEKPFRASPDKPKTGEQLVKELSASDKRMERIRKMKESQGG